MAQKLIYSKGYDRDAITYGLGSNGGYILKEKNVILRIYGMSKLNKMTIFLPIANLHKHK